MSTTNSGESGHYDCYGGYVWVWIDEINGWGYVWCDDCDCTWTTDYYWYEKTIQVTGTTTVDDYGIVLSLSDSTNEVFIIHGNGGTISQLYYYTSNDAYPTGVSATEITADVASSYIRTAATGMSYDPSSYVSYYTHDQIGQMVSDNAGITLDAVRLKIISDEGCIGLARVLMEVSISGHPFAPGGNFPETHPVSPETVKVYKTLSDLNTYGGCSGSPTRQLIIVKDGAWNGSEPTPDANHQIPSNSVIAVDHDTDNTSFNYIVSVKNGTGSWGNWMGINYNHTIAHPQSGWAFSTLPACSFPAREYIKVCIP